MQAWERMGNVLKEVDALSVTALVDAFTVPDYALAKFAVP